MFIGHLPGAYLALKASPTRIAPVLFGTALVGSVLPDVDLAAFYFWHDRAFHHHEYITHRPLIWVGLLALGLILSRRMPGTVLTGLGVGGVIHMLLDSITGQITWGWPVSDFAQPLVVVPATRSHWILSFLTHWTFLVEITVCSVAALVWWRSSRN
ncbi:metal-dependent hydrolase [Arenibacterium sp. CAU 1754]